MRDGQRRLGSRSAQILTLFALFNGTMLVCCISDYNLPRNHSHIVEFDPSRVVSREDNENRKIKAPISRTTDISDKLQDYATADISRTIGKSLTEPPRLLVAHDNDTSSHNIGSDYLTLGTLQYSEPWFETKSTQDSIEIAESAKSEVSTDCALILKRTYIIRSKNNDEWGDKFVFNENDPDDKKPQIHKSDLCIKHSDVDRAIEEAKHLMKFSKPSDIDSFEVSERSIASVAELSLATGQLLAKKFDLSHDEILNALPMIDMSSSKFFWKELCPKNVRSMICSKSRYRTITAHCNNLKHPSWGASNTPYSRYLPPDYADGLDLPRASRDGSPLPSARLVSSIIHTDTDSPSNDHSILFASWGQLLDHDMTRAALGNGK